ncbi:hypothetical protein [Natronomonas amylolytica]|uniref:hypothetical protein n=1 Tax=Natronomonas amylolytica TaxID=3108498 RepID=UPI00300AB720
MGDERWHIEGEFRDGSKRVRDSDGQYQSVSTAILEEVSEFETFSESDLASRLGVDETVVLEHLGHLKNEGLITGNSGSWSKEPDAIEDAFSGENEHYFPWEGRNSDDESIY